MATIATTDAAPKKSRGSLLYDPKIRGLVYQIGLISIVIMLFYFAASNAIDNLRRARIASGFGFWNTTSGFDISQTLIRYSSSGSTYGEAFIVGLLNTLLVAAIGVVLATFIGFAMGVARLSKNWLIARLATIYVETIRNIPLLLQLFFWYYAVLGSLPQPRESASIAGSIFVNTRGLFVPKPILAADAWLLPCVAIAGIVGAIAFRFWARKQQHETGRQYPVFLTAIGLIIGLPALVWTLLALVGANPISFDFPIKATFNLRGGMQLVPEFVALLVGLSIYTGAFIAEVVRAGILAVSRGQTEAANALGLRSSPTLRLVVIPQAMRVIIPPLTSQYLNLTKNSSLAVAIGYPDLAQVFMGTVLNQTGQAVEVIAITMAVYLTISIVTSSIMNIYNRRVALVER